MPSLRKYQSEDVDTLRETLRGGAKKVLFEASVGYGKSVVIEHLAAAYSAAGRKVWVLSNRSAVVSQLRDRAGDLPVVEVMTVQAADRRRERLAADPAALILVDEVHMGGAAAQYRRVLDCAPDAVAIGFTGTPRPETFEVFNAHVQGRGAAWLTEKGFLAPLRYVCPDPLDLSGVRVKRGEYDEAQVMQALQDRKIYSDAIKSYEKYGHLGPTLGFCVNVQHAEDTATEFRATGHPCEVLTGKDSDDEVERKIGILADGGLVFSVDKVSAGFDLPDLRVLLSLRPTASEQLWVQQLGRVARAKADGGAGLVVDHVGNTLRLGTLTETRDWRNPEERKSQEKTEDGQALSIRQCDECMSVFPSGPSKCPMCDAVLGKDTRIPKAEAVRLRELEEEEIRKQRERAKAVRSRAGMGIKQRTGFLAGSKKWRWPEARAEAIRVVSKRRDEAIQAGDTEVAAFLASDLQSNGVQI
ncbi:superfamily II DNA or RNA helicase [Roseovarius halotolerans]|uniref:Type I restriction enzyme EcoKI subunit R n=2 Tax=Roseovarius halotolerans TaxID=505353 RepID=A0A1X6Y602_9RHOB|nr:superfamily II DNA or RNA helicase [Roseovarius halotolerans]SLN11050.1 type I restriction enzyme EcoKI subunit R [Roseovarius halotolerans]